MSCPCEAIFRKINQAKNDRVVTGPVTATERSKGKNSCLLPPVFANLRRSRQIAFVAILFASRYLSRGTPHVWAS